MTDRNALANTVRSLPVIASLGEMWQKRPEETDSQYRDFLEWLDLGSKRGSPPNRCTDAANRHEWAQRALAYERAWELQRGLDAGQKSPEGQIVDNLTRMVQIETAKLLKQSVGEVGPVISLTDMIKTVSLLKDMQLQEIKAGSQRADLSKLSVDELKQVLAAQATLAKVRK